MFDYKRNSMRKYTATEIYHFYIRDNHWLFMEKSKMILILEGIRKELNDIRGWEAAYDLVQNATKEEIKEMRIAYYNRYGWKPDLRNVNGRYRVYRPEGENIKIEVNQN